MNPGRVVVISLVLIALLLVTVRPPKVLVKKITIEEGEHGLQVEQVVGQIERKDIDLFNQMKGPYREGIRIETDLPLQLSWYACIFAIGAFLLQLIPRSTNNQAINKLEHLLLKKTKNPGAALHRPPIFFAAS